MTTDIVWEAPDFDKLNRRKTSRHWDAIVEELQTKPNEWARIAEFSYSYAYTITRNLKDAYGDDYEFIRGPEILSDDSSPRGAVYARYVG